MKNTLLSLRLLALVVIIAAAGVSTSSSPAPQNDPDPDPGCVRACAGLMFECFVDGGKNNDHDHACISVYRHCMAQCGKQ